MFLQCQSFLFWNCHCSRSWIFNLQEFFKPCLLPMISHSGSMNTLQVLSLLNFVPLNIWIPTHTLRSRISNNSDSRDFLEKKIPYTHLVFLFVFSSNLIDFRLCALFAPGFTSFTSSLSEPPFESFWDSNNAHLAFGMHTLHISFKRNNWNSSNFITDS